MKRMTMSMINDSLHHRWGRWWMTLMMTTDNTDQRDKEKKEANSISQELPSKCPVCKKGKKTTFSSISGWKNLVISWKGFATNAIYIIATWWWLNPLTPASIPDWQEFNQHDYVWSYKSKRPGRGFTNKLDLRIASKFLTSVPETPIVRQFLHSIPQT